LDVVGISDDEARGIAHREFRPVPTAKVDGCSCGRGGWGRAIGAINVVRGIDWESGVRVAARVDAES
jgi:hypothetical protein